MLHAGSWQPPPPVRQPSVLSTTIAQQIAPSPDTSPGRAIGVWPAGTPRQPHPPGTLKPGVRMPLSPKGNILLSLADCSALTSALEAPADTPPAGPLTGIQQLQGWLNGVDAVPSRGKTSPRLPNRRPRLKSPRRRGPAPAVPVVPVQAASRRPTTAPVREATEPVRTPTRADGSDAETAAVEEAVADGAMQDLGLFSPSAEEPDLPPEDKPSPHLKGCNRFRAAVANALKKVSGSDLDSRWEAVAALIERASGDHDGADAAKLADNERSASGAKAAPFTQEAAASVVSLTDLLLCRLQGLQPALSAAIGYARRRLMAVLFALPPTTVEFEAHDRRALKKAASRARKALKSSVRLTVGPDTGPRSALGSAGLLERYVSSHAVRRYIIDQGLCGLVDELMREVTLHLPKGVCGFMAHFFVEKMSAVPVSVGDARAVTEDGMVYLSRNEALGTAAGKATTVDTLTAPVKVASPFLRFVNRRVSDGVQYSAASLHRHRMFPTAKRLAVTFLELLGRRKNKQVQFTTRSDIRDATGDCIYHVPKLELAVDLHERHDNQTDIVINARAVDKTGVHAPIDEVYWHHCPTGAVSGPAAASIYGLGEFRISIGEIKELELSTRVATAGGMSPRFFTELASIATKADNTWFFSLCRAVPLSKLSDHRCWDELAETYEERFVTERYKVLALEDKRVELLEAMHESSGGGWEWVGGAHAFCSSADAPPLDVLAEFDYDLHQHRLWRDNSYAHLEYLKKREEMTLISDEVDAWMTHLKQRPREYGFDSVRDVDDVTRQSLTELCTSICVSQKGYYFVDGMDGNANQLAPKTPQPVTFISAAGLDFNTPSTTLLEMQKYFHKPPAAPGTPAHLGFRGFLPNGEDRMLQRLRDLYTVIFESCYYNHVRNPSMIGLGLGVFLLNVHPSDCRKVQELYFRAQYQLLSERDWGFDCYYLNPGPLSRVAREVLEVGMHNKEFNHPGTGRFFRCSIVIHQKDAKFLAVQLAKSCADPAVLNPSDCAAVTLGQMGYYWETGRAGYYVGEEDLATTSTALLAHSGISDTLTNIGRCIEVGGRRSTAEAPRGSKDAAPSLFSTILNSTTSAEGRAGPNTPLKRATNATSLASRGSRP